MKTKSVIAMLCIALFGATVIAGPIIVRQVDVKNGAGVWRHSIAADGLLRVVAIQTQATNGVVTASIDFGAGLPYVLGSVTSSVGRVVTVPNDAYVQHGQTIKIANTSTNTVDNAKTVIFLEKVNE